MIYTQVKRELESFCTPASGSVSGPKPVPFIKYELLIKRHRLQGRNRDQGRGKSYCVYQKHTTTRMHHRLMKEAVGQAQLVPVTIPPTPRKIPPIPPMLLMLLMLLCW